MAAAPPLDDPTALAQFGRLEVVARLLVEGYLLGQHRSPFKGTSVEFVEHRQYTPGDELRHIDWRAYAKTGKYYVKQFEEETNLRAYLLLDVSGSMAYAGQTLSKLDYAKTVAAALAYLLLTQRDACGLITFADKVLDRREPATQQATFPELVQLMEARAPGREGRIAPVLHELLPTLKRRSLVWLMTDAFDDPSALAATLKQYRIAGHDVIFLQIAAPEEETFPFRRPTLFRDLEAPAQQRPVDPLQLRRSYLDRYQAFCATLKQDCAAAGLDHVKLVTNEPYERALGAYLTYRAQRR
ncbi:MAG: DUF58 domain-containing protein [Planctomycetaceae bacterium]|nr:DUF58 domain-containing protein [Planctomycetaceae bacterium]